MSAARRIDVRHPDMVLVEGKIATVDQNGNIAEALAICDGRISGIRSSAEIHGNSPSLWWYFNEVRWRWLKSLQRRSQRAFMSWEKFTSITDRFFPSIRILHPLPCHRFDARTRGKSPVR
jgi:hypothetical protein